MKIYQVILWILATTGLILAEFKLSGKIQDMTLVPENSPYLITDNLIVPAGQKLVIPSGCVLLFKPFTGLTVEGVLEVNGTAEKPVVFTSENDTRYNPASSQFPNPFDWNGIIVNKNAGAIQLSNFSIKYSVYGLKSYKEDIIIVDGVFQSNGQSNLTVFETMKNVADGIPYNYRLEPQTNQKGQLSGGFTDHDTQPAQSENKKEKKSVSKYKMGAYGCAGAGVVCLGITAYFVSQVIVNQKRYLSSETKADIDLYKSMRSSSGLYAAVSVVPTLLFTGGTIFFLKKDKKVEKREQLVSLIPFVGESKGLIVSIKF